jgi:CheY-like chemotaxis protein
MGQTSPIHKQIVLVVEDDSLLRMMAADLVEQAGFEVVEAEDADEAVRILETRSDIRIVFTDIDMPGSMNGIRLAAAIRDRWPPIDIIITSGHVRAGEFDLPERSVFFSKPYDSMKVTKTLQNMASQVY